MKGKLFLLFVLMVFVFVGSVQADPNDKTEAPSFKNSILTKLELPDAVLDGANSFEKVTAFRRNLLQFSTKSLELTQIAQLAWAGAGIVDKKNGFRTAPSTGNTYPIQLYFVIRGGVYLYNPGEHSLRKVFAGNVINKLAAATSNRPLQAGVAKAPCNIIIAGAPRKMMAKFGIKGRRFMLLEAGHIAQNIQLQAVSLGLGAVAIAEFNEAEAAKICKLSGDQEAILIICVGNPAEGSAVMPAKIDEKPVPVEPSRSKKVVFIIPHDGFENHELFDTLDVLSVAGVQVIMAGSELGPIKDTRNIGQIEVTMHITDINAEGYDGLIFIGGAGVNRYAENPVVLDLVRRAAEQEKVIAAIGTAPAILAEAGVLAGRRATVRISKRNKLKKAGAEYTGTYVERDENIITARYPRAASEFGKAIVDALADKAEPKEDEKTIRRRQPKSKTKSRRDTK